jgi:hypothetical protein
LIQSGATGTFDYSELGMVEKGKWRISDFRSFLKTWECAGNGAVDRKSGKKNHQLVAPQMAI